MRKVYSIGLFFIMILILTLYTGLNHVSFAKEKGGKKKRIGKVVEVKGKAMIIRNGKRMDAKKEKDVILKDTSKTEDDSLLTIHMIEDTLVILDENTLLSFDKYKAGDKKRRGESIMFLRDGWIRVKTCNNRIKVLTPLAKASAVYRTSDFEVWKTVKEGRVTFCIGVVRDSNRRMAIVDFKNKKGGVRVPEGYMSCIGADGAPEEPYLIPKDIYDKILEVKGAVEWKCKERCVEGEVFRKGGCVERCNECERLNPQGVCVPDNCKPCDDGNPCTVDDHCLGRRCKGRRVPSPVDPRCVE